MIAGRDAILRVHVSIAMRSTPGWTRRIASLQIAGSQLLFIGEYYKIPIVCKFNKKIGETEHYRLYKNVNFHFPSFNEVSSISGVKLPLSEMVAIMLRSALNCLISQG